MPPSPADEATEPPVAEMLLIVLPTPILYPVVVVTEIIPPFPVPVAFADSAREVAESVDACNVICPPFELPATASTDNVPVGIVRVPDEVTRLILPPFPLLLPGVTDRLLTELSVMPPVLVVVTDIVPPAPLVPVALADKVPVVPLVVAAPILKTLVL